jgi:hypothetical protein
MIKHNLNKTDDRIIQVGGLGCSWCGAWKQPCTLWCPTKSEFKILYNIHRGDSIIAEASEWDDGGKGKKFSRLDKSGKKEVTGSQEGDKAVCKTCGFTIEFSSGVMGNSTKTKLQKLATFNEGYKDDLQKVFELNRSENPTVENMVKLHQKIFNGNECEVKHISDTNKTKQQTVWNQTDSTQCKECKTKLNRGEHHCRNCGGKIHDKCSVYVNKKFIKKLPKGYKGTLAERHNKGSRRYRVCKTCMKLLQEENPNETLTINTSSNLLTRCSGCKATLIKDKHHCRKCKNPICSTCINLIQYELKEPMALHQNVNGKYTANETFPSVKKREYKFCPECEISYKKKRTKELTEEANQKAQEAERERSQTANREQTLLEKQKRLEAEIEQSREIQSAIAGASEAAAAAEVAEEKQRIELKRQIEAKKERLTAELLAERSNSSKGQSHENRSERQGQQEQQEQEKEREREKKERERERERELERDRREQENKERRERRERERELERDRREQQELERERREQERREREQQQQRATEQKTLSNRIKSSKESREIETCPYPCKSCYPATVMLEKQIEEVEDKIKKIEGAPKTHSTRNTKRKTLCNSLCKICYPNTFDAVSTIEEIKKASELAVKAEKNIQNALKNNTSNLDNKYSKKQEIEGKIIKLEEQAVSQIKKIKDELTQIGIYIARLNQHKKDSAESAADVARTKRLKGLVNEKPESKELSLLIRPDFGEDVVYDKVIAKTETGPIFIYVQINTSKTDTEIIKTEKIDEIDEFIEKINKDNDCKCERLQVIEINNKCLVVICVY